MTSSRALRTMTQQQPSKMRDNLLRPAGRNGILKLSELPPWIKRARETLVASFASGVAKDEAAVRAANRLAMVKRPDRGPNHTAQTGKATNVRSRQNRPSSSQVNWRRLNVDDLLHQNCVRAKIACRMTPGTLGFLMIGGLLQPDMRSDYRERSSQIWERRGLGASSSFV